ncbi:hypothetical protein C0991_007168 [Blastosporella zonata]|nr:hypothetical protein C0991_007168 [Blastosporella zonata]
MPFVRYIAQFIDFEFNNIQSQDKGMGVDHARCFGAYPPFYLTKQTSLITLNNQVPRPWDFAPLPASSPATPPAPTSTSEVTGIEPALREPSVLLPVLSSTSPSSTSPPNPNSPSSPIPNSKPVPIQSTMTITPVTPAETPASLPTFADSIVGAYANSVTFHPVAAPLVTTKSEGNGRGVGDVN